jgi:hypothetical protein
MRVQDSRVQPLRSSREMRMLMAYPAAPVTIAFLPVSLPIPTLLIVWTTLLVLEFSPDILRIESKFVPQVRVFLEFSQLCLLRLRFVT